MKDRIKQLIDATGMSIGDFAVSVESSQPVFSHIFKGRNKPSLEVAYKILSVYTNVSTDWLIMGNGPMFKDPLLTADGKTKPSGFNTNHPVNHNNSPIPSLIDPEMEPDIPLSQTVSQSVVTPSNVSAQTASVQNSHISEQAETKEKSQTIQSAGTVLVSSNSGSTGKDVILTNDNNVPFLVSSQRSIKKVMVFYSDDTFAEYKVEPL